MGIEKVGGIARGKEDAGGRRQIEYEPDESKITQ
jgi:hypothetical protein